MIKPTIKEYTVRSCDVSVSNEATPQAIFHFLEDVAFLNANENGFGYDKTSTQHIGWFLIKYHLIFDCPLHAEEKIKVKTWPSKTKGVFCKREFEIYNESGKRVGIATSLWLLVDIESKKILNPYKTFNITDLEEVNNIENPFTKIPEIENIDYQKIFSVCFDDIDLNKHVNNASYIKYAINTLPFEFLTHHFAKEINIQYKQEAKIGEDIISSLSLDKEKNITTHILKDRETGVVFASILIYWS